MRDRDQTQRAVAACRAALDTHGLLLVQDATLASITTLTVGEPVRGSWWGHELAHTIFDVIATLEAEVAVVKLVDKKQTLVHERLWPAIVGIGAARSKWQINGLSDAALAALRSIDHARVPVDPDALGGDEKPAAILRELELRLLVMTNEIHTDSGRHVKKAIGWGRWAEDHGLAPSAIPDELAARAALDGAVRSIGGAGRRKLVPWPPGE